ASLRLSVEISSGFVRHLFGCCSGTTRSSPEQHPKDYRSCPEQVPKRTRSASEECPNSTRRNRLCFYYVLRTLETRTKCRCSTDEVLFMQLLRHIDDVSL